MSYDLSFSSTGHDGIDVLVIAGEASGDEHASSLIGNLKSAKPDLRIAALGGPKLKQSGASVIFDLVAHAVVGVFEVLKNYLFFRELFDLTIKWIELNRPKVILLVDYPGFNLRLASELRRRGLSKKGGGEILILQYIGPQLWAWKSKRRFQMEQTLDALAVIFPFELDCYQDVSLPVSFVGHPFASPSYNSRVAYEKDGDLLLLPGSRTQPISRILPFFLDSLEILLSEGRELHAVLPCSNPKIAEFVDDIISLRSEDIRNCVKISEVEESILSARAALMSSGTMSLACAWAGVPGVIAYRAHPVTYLMGKLLVKVPHLGMANLLLPERLPNPEFLQGRAKGHAIAMEIGKILDDPDAGKYAGESAELLHSLLSEGKEKSVVDWLVQAGRLA